MFNVPYKNELIIIIIMHVIHQQYHALLVLNMKKQAA